MTAPRRWKDSPDAPVGMRELIGSARAPRPLDEATFKRGAERLARVSVAPAAIAAVSIWAKLAAAGVVGLAAVGTAVAVGAHHEPVATAPSVRAAAPPARAEGSDTPAEAPSTDLAPPPAVANVAEPPAAAPAPPSRAATAPAAKPKAVEPARVEPEATRAPDAGAEISTTKSSLTDELELLEEARAAITRSPELALAPLERHRARHPYGTLADERELMEIDVLRRIGRVQDARSRAHAWLARDPNGMFAPRVRAILATLEP